MTKALIKKQTKNPPKNTKNPTISNSQHVLQNFFLKKIKVSLRNLLLKNLETTQEIQTQSTNSLRKKQQKRYSLKFFKKINQASSGSMLKQTDLPFTTENKMLFLLRGGICWMQGNYVTFM